GATFGRGTAAIRSGAHGGKMYENQQLTSGDGGVRGTEIAACDTLMNSAEVRSGLGGWGSRPTRSGATGRAPTSGLLCVVVGMAGLALLGGCGGPSRTSQVPSTALLPPPPMTIEPDYRLQLGDTLKVSFLFQPENDIDLVVRPDGRISLSAVGEIEAVGKTERELEEIITERASEHLRNPVVTVSVTKIGTQNVYVGGEVLRPGVVTLVPGMTPLQAVMEQGGFRPTAKRDS